jgi:2-dehydropantoate 2-reductase
MRILVIGAGAIGGYFGGRLLEAGADVTFLVRPERAARLAEAGLVIKSRYGDVFIAAPPTIMADGVRGSFDVILLSCKAYDLESAIDAFAPALGPRTVVIPVLNGMRHMDVLDRRLGAERVLGGQCFMSARLGPKGEIVHLSDVHELCFGERSGERTPRLMAVAEAMGGAKFTCRVSDAILHEMWEKWVFLATLAGINCLLRASIGDIVAAGGADLAVSLLEECREIAAAAGWPPRAAFLQSVVGRLTASGSGLIASLLIDVERGGRTEADHILGDLLRRRGPVADSDRSLLRLAYTAIQASAARARRERDGESRTS